MSSLPPSLTRNNLQLIATYICKSSFSPPGDSHYKKKLLLNVGPMPSSRWPTYYQFNGILGSILSYNMKLEDFFPYKFFEYILLFVVWGQHFEDLTFLSDLPNFTQDKRLPRCDSLNSIIYVLQNADLLLTVIIIFICIIFKYFLHCLMSICLSKWY